MRGDETCVLPGSGQVMKNQWKNELKGSDFIAGQ